MKKKIILMILSFIIGVAAIFYLGFDSDKRAMSFSNTDDLQMYFFNAGKADCTIIKQGDVYIMIDTGTEDLKEDIIHFLKQNDISRIDYFIITHFDKDHAGCAADVLTNCDIGTVYQSSYVKENSYYEDYVSALSNKGIQPTIVTNDLILELNDLTIKINGSNKTYSKDKSNNSSLITSIYYDNLSYLFMGDAQKDRINDFLKENSTHYSFIKMPHHGSYEKALAKLIKATTPNIAVITSSDEENEDSETKSLLKEYNCKYYLTRKGSILIKSDGKKMSITQENQ